MGKEFQFQVVEETRVPGKMTKLPQARKQGLRCEVPEVEVRSTESRCKAPWIEVRSTKAFLFNWGDAFGIKVRSTESMCSTEAFNFNWAGIEVHSTESRR